MEKERDIFHPSIVMKMWYSSWNLAGVIFIILLWYVYFYYGVLHFLAVSTATAGTAAILIGLSFAMSGFAYYFDFLDQKVAYRKYMGLTGYYIALVYTVMLLFLDSEKYFFGIFKNFFQADYLLGTSAMLIFTFIAMISNKGAMQKLGPKNWRQCLRLGYIAYALLILRAIVLEKDLWATWAVRGGILPPPRMLITIFALGVIFLRLSIIYSKYIHRRPGLSENG